LLENPVHVLNVRARGAYVSLDQHTNLLNGTVELIEGNLASVLDVEELEASGEELLLSLVRRALLGEFLLQLSLEAIRGKGEAFTLA